MTVYNFFLVLEFESLYMENLPLSETYERSYMHRDVVTFVVVTKTDFVITASQDGHLKFWKKQVGVLCMFYWAASGFIYRHYVFLCGHLLVGTIKSIDFIYYIITDT